MAQGAEKKLILPNEENILLSARSADRLIQWADGDAALVYIYILRKNGQLDTAQAAKELCRTENEIIAAVSRLVKMGLVKDEQHQGRLQEDKLPEYTAEDIRRASQTGGFSELVQEVQKALGKILSSADMTKLLGIYKELGLPEDVILMLVNHCIAESSRRYGPGRVPTMRYIEKAAFTWEREGILTIEDAERYIKQKEQLRSARQQIKKVLQIKDRELSASERRYVDAWIEKGFGADAIEIAYDRTLVKTGRLAWAYMNSIINNWHEKGIHTSRDILRREGSARTRDANGTQISGGAEELDSMRRFLDELNKD